MTTCDDCNFDTNVDVLNNMTDAEAKKYFDDFQADYWIEEYKNNHDLM